MKITETIKRECCQKQDLRPYNGVELLPDEPARYLFFCVHCGQVWVSEKPHLPPTQGRQGLKRLPV